MKFLPRYGTILLSLLLFGWLIDGQAADDQALRPPSVVEQPTSTRGGYATQARQAAAYRQPMRPAYSGPAIQTRTPVIVRTAPATEIPVYIAPMIERAVSAPGVVVSMPRTMIYQPPTTAVEMPAKPVTVSQPPTTARVLQPPSTPAVAKTPETPTPVTPKEPTETVADSEVKVAEAEVLTADDAAAAHEDVEADKIRKRQENMMLQQMAQAVRTETAEMAQALLYREQVQPTVTVDATERRFMFEAAIAKQREQTQRLGALLKQKMVADTSVAMVKDTSIFNQLWPIMLLQVEQEVQDEKDKRDQEARERIERIRKRLKDMLERNKRERERRRKDRRRKRNMQRQREMDDRRGKLGERRGKLDRRRERIENKKKEFEWKDKDYREREQEARKRGDMDEVRRIRGEREALQQERYKNMKDEVALQKDVDSYQRDWRKFDADNKEFEKSLDRGEGMTKTEWKEHVLTKERRKLIERGNNLHDEISKLENKSRRPDYELTKTEKQRLKNLRGQYKANDLERAKYEAAINEVQTELRETQGGTWGELTRQTDDQLDKQAARMEKTIAGLQEIEDRIGKGGEQPENSDKFGKQMEGIHDKAGKLNKDFQTAVDRYEKAAAEHEKNLKSFEGLERKQRNLETELENVRNRVQSGKMTKAEYKANLEEQAKLEAEIKDVKNKIDLNNQHLARERNAFQIAQNEHDKEFSKLTEQADTIQDDLMLEGINNWTNDYNRSYGDTIDKDGKVNIKNLEKRVKQLESFTDAAGDMTRAAQGLQERRTGLTESVNGQPSLAKRLKLSPEQVKAAQDNLDRQLQDIHNAEDRLIGEMSNAGFELESRVDEEGRFRKYVIVQSNNPLVATYCQAVDNASRELAGLDKRDVKGQKDTMVADASPPASRPKLQPKVEQPASTPSTPKPVAVTPAPKSVAVTPAPEPTPRKVKITPAEVGRLRQTTARARQKASEALSTARKAEGEVPEAKKEAEKARGVAQQARQMSESYGKTKQRQAGEYKELADRAEERVEDARARAEELRGRARKLRETADRYARIADTAQDRELATKAREAASNAEKEAARLEGQTEDRERQAEDDAAHARRYRGKQEEFQGEADELAFKAKSAEAEAAAKQAEAQRRQARAAGLRQKAEQAWAESSAEKANLQTAQAENLRTTLKDPPSDTFWSDMTSLKRSGWMRDNVPGWDGLSTKEQIKVLQVVDFSEARKQAMTAAQAFDRSVKDRNLTKQGIKERVDRIKSLQEQLKKKKEDEWDIDEDDRREIDRLESEIRVERDRFNRDLRDFGEVRDDLIKKMQKVMRQQWVVDEKSRNQEVGRRVDQLARGKGELQLAREAAKARDKAFSERISGIRMKMQAAGDSDAVEEHKTAIERLEEAQNAWSEHDSSNIRSLEKIVDQKRDQIAHDAGADGLYAISEGGRLDELADQRLKESGVVSGRLPGQNKLVRDVVDGIDVKGEEFSASGAILDAYDSAKIQVATQAGAVYGTVKGVAKGLYGLGKLVLWEPIDMWGETLERNAEDITGWRPNLFGDDNYEFINQGIDDPEKMASDMFFGLGKEVYDFAKNFEKLHEAAQAKDAGHAFDAASGIGEFIGENVLDPTMVLGGLAKVGKLAKLVKTVDEVSDVARAADKAVDTSRVLDKAAGLKSSTAKLPPAETGGLKAPAVKPPPSDLPPSARPGSSRLATEAPPPHFDSGASTPKSGSRPSASPEGSELLTPDTYKGFDHNPLWVSAEKTKRPKSTVETRTAGDNAKRAEAPVEGEKWIAPDGREFHLREKLGGESAYASVYALDDKWVIKALDKKTSESLMLSGKSVPMGKVVDDMIHGENLLSEAGIMHKRTTQAVPDGNPPYVIQERLAPDEYLLGRNAKLTSGQQEAVLGLYDQLAEKGLIWADGHIENIYFKKLPGKDQWAAGILDGDFIARFGDVPSERLAEHFECLRQFHYAGVMGINIKSMGMGHDWFPSSAREFMGKMLEHKRWIDFDDTGFKDYRLKIGDVKKKFDLTSPKLDQSSILFLPVPFRTPWRKAAVAVAHQNGWALRRAA